MSVNRKRLKIPLYIFGFYALEFFISIIYDATLKNFRELQSVTPVLLVCDGILSLHATDRQGTLHNKFPQLSDFSSLSIDGRSIVG
jgi:hypothetical protein